MQSEFKKLKDGEEIYKLIGPALLKQDKVEAEGTVNGRLEFIGKEMYVVPVPISLFTLPTLFCPRYYQDLPACLVRD